ncbi:hypothetical protein BBK36DRAFT_1169503 [Trichoderma citrinoviride]|uniref:Autophagy-related protein 28 n=1 Tax=Trichoderma citrinoviride TaxID=58853 RepID=A0A2T4B9B8_9HYPO|nr:hypothetical protein BBK36DRAFT_1169503 [Trichoderma citrinoviride]PTB65811.1 hypothetical protein BBK36DRAFT_1169503 [Trichoderma citrinoviride]
MAFFERMTSPHRNSPLLPLHNPPRRLPREPSEYQLNELDPRPDDASSTEGDLPRAWQSHFEEPSASRGASPTTWRDNTKTETSQSVYSIKQNQRPMFAGPPPPITASMLISKESFRADSVGPSGRKKPTPYSLLGGSPTEANSVLFDHRREAAMKATDTVWRGLRRQEKALEKEVQLLLDQQAAALAAGTGNENDGSSTGSSTPTSTFYSTKSSKSKMTSSLYVPPRTTRDGNVVPIRQPTNDKPPGLRSTRGALRELITSMTRLKEDEHAHLDDAMMQRQDALNYLERLGTRKTGIQAELDDLTENGDEPLARELRDLSTQHDTLGKEIQLLEEKLAAMRIEHRTLEERIDDIKNKREAGLSGYYGALRDVTNEANAFVQHPQIQPLDEDLLWQGGEAEGDPAASGGRDFMRLIPERRTLEMAKSWWTAEMAVLKRCKERIDADRQALEEGGQVWDRVTQLVSDFEAELRQAMQGGTAASSSSSSPKGKDKVPSQEDIISDQLSRMKQVIEELEDQLKLAEEKRWNLLICAIGAELEAFKEAHNVLSSLLHPPEKRPPGDGGDAPDNNNNNNNTEAEPEHRPATQKESSHVVHDEESDNEVPSDFLSGEQDASDEHAIADNSSENEVPPEFLVEHV